MKQDVEVFGEQIVLCVRALVCVFACVCMCVAQTRHCLFQLMRITGCLFC